MQKKKILDLFCKAGGSGNGYAEAGFEVVGVDIEPQKRYPFEFIQASAFEVLADANFMARSGFDAIHASPVRKVHTSLNQIPQTRAMLAATGLPYVIENVPGAPLQVPVTLCGSMFGLGVRCHRLFEVNFEVYQPDCQHADQDAASPMYAIKRYHFGKDEVDMWRTAMGVDWMTRDELAQAIPPAYAKFIGASLMLHLTAVESRASRVTAVAPGMPKIPH